MNILWSSIVERHNRESKDVAQKGEWGVFDFARPRSGCQFAPRCPVYEEKGRPSICTDPDSEPHLCDIGNAHKVACHFPL